MTDCVTRVSKVTRNVCSAKPRELGLYHTDTFTRETFRMGVLVKYRDNDFFAFGFDFRICRGLFLEWKIIPRYIKTSRWADKLVEVRATSCN